MSYPKQISAPLGLSEWECSDGKVFYNSKMAQSHENGLTKKETMLDRMSDNSFESILEDNPTGEQIGGIMTHEEFEERLKELQRQEVICSGMLLNNIKQLIIELIGEDESRDAFIEKCLWRNELRAELRKTINGEEYGIRKMPDMW